MDLTGQLSNPPVALDRLSKRNSRPRNSRVGSTPPVAAGDRHQGTQVQRRLKPDRVQELVAAYLAGATVKELAAWFTIHKTTVTGHLRREGVPLRPRGLRPGDVPVAADLYASGWSLARVGERFSVDAETVRTTLRDAGVTIRPRRGWTAS